MQKDNTPDITHEHLLEILDYSPDTGLFTWKKKIASKTVVGARAGSDKPNGNGYLRMRIYGRLYYTHRLAWFYMNGVWPEHEIDHADHNKQNNQIENLRAVDRKENSKNWPKRPGSNPVCGVFWEARRNSWCVRIKIDGRSIYLGNYKDFDAAVAARQAANIVHGFHENHGKEQIAA